MKKKSLIIGVIILIILFGVCGYFVYDKSLSNDKDDSDNNGSISEKWGESYYVYLKDNDNVSFEDAKVSFINTTKQDNPVMLIRYDKNGKHYTNVYYIDNDKINSIIYDKPVDVVYLYNLKDKTYNYYLHLEDSKKDYYQSIDKQIELNKKDSDKKSELNAEYSFTKEKLDAVKNSSGETIAIGEFEKNFMEVKVDIKYVDFNSKMNDEEIKDIVIKSINNYVSKDKLLGDDIDELISKHEKNIKEYSNAVEKDVVNNFYKKIVKNGYFCRKDKYTYYCINVKKEGNKYYFDSMYYATEAGGREEIKDVEYKGKNVYVLKFKKGSTKIDITNIGKNTIVVDGKTYKFFTSKQLEDAVY